MTGRARGRARGRGNRSSAVPRRPGNPPLADQPPVEALQRLNLSSGASPARPGNAWNSAAHGGRNQYEQQGARPRDLQAAINMPRPVSASAQNGPINGAVQAAYQQPGHAICNRNGGGAQVHAPRPQPSASSRPGNSIGANVGVALQVQQPQPQPSASSHPGNTIGANVGGALQVQQPQPQPSASSHPGNGIAANIGDALQVQHRPDNANGARIGEPHVQAHPPQPAVPNRQNQLSVITNYFALTRAPGVTPLHQYALVFHPELEDPGRRMRVLRAVQNVIGDVWVYDRGFTVFLMVRLPDAETKCYGTIPLRDNPDGLTVEVTITHTNEVFPDSPSFGHLLNIVMRRIKSTLGMTRVGEHSFFPNPISIPQHKLELLPGFKTSIQRHENSYLLGLDVLYKVVRVESVLDFLFKLFEKFRTKNREHKFHDETERQLLGQIVITRYNNKTYRVMEVEWDGRPSDKFSLKNGEATTFNAYYAQHYGKTISDQEQPLLLGKPKGGRKGQPDSMIKLIPELCYLTGMTEDIKNDFHIRKEIAVYTRVGPRERSEELLKFVKQINENPDVARTLQSLGLQIDNNLSQVNGRQLPTETILQKNRTHSFDPARADWSNEMKGSPMHSTIGLKTWVVIATRRDGDLANDFCRTLKRVGEPMEVAINPPQIELLQNDHISSYLAALRGLIQQMQPDLVVTIVPTNAKDRYDAIKKLCCNEMPVPSQVIVSRTLSKRQMLMSVCTKICNQINCKLGGEPWLIQGNPPILSDLMVVGIDVCHVAGAPSVGAFVSSRNGTFTKYFSRCTSHDAGQELSDGLTVRMTAALRAYMEDNRKLPKKIIVFRDGVGEGQLDMVREHEIPQFKLAFETVTTGEPYRPELAVIIVQKRIITRLFRPNPRGRGQTDVSNPVPGTVVDTVVTSPQHMDFFLVSQSCRQGTTTPTHYNVIYNTFPPNWTMPIFQRLSYRLTHLYFNWPGTIRVPAPCQYAHKLAFLVGQSLHKEPHLQLADKLFYL